MSRIGERFRAGKTIFVLAAAALLLGACVAPLADDYGYYADGYDADYYYAYDYPLYGYPRSYGHRHHLGSRRDHRHRPGHRAVHGPRRGHSDARPDHDGRKRDHAAGKPGHAGPKLGHAEPKPGHAGPKLGHVGPKPGHVGPKPGHAAGKKLRHGDGPGLGERSRDRARPAVVKRRAAPASTKRAAIRAARGNDPRRQPRTRRPAGAAVESHARPDHVSQGTTEGAKKDAKKQAKKRQRAPTALLLRPARPAPGHARGAGRSARRDREY